MTVLAGDQADGRHLVLKINRRYPKSGELLGSGRLFTAEAFHAWMAHNASASADGMASGTYGVRARSHGRSSPPEV
ncbi:hypothetical protein ABZ467_34455 [Streptomyces sp. NPDC005727]|uniref:hypothetical protein n=1 Tax=Streptomyces sp. NPDC005727 TaxID=3157053 RepID=UPI0034033110